MVRDYLAHRLIGTPLETPARGVRGLRRLVKRWRHPELSGLFREDGCIDAALRRIITPGMNCLDAGCHLGSMLSRMGRLAPGGRHLAFEPVPYKVRWLRRRFPEVEIIEAALADTTGEAEFFVHRRWSGFSGLRPRKGDESHPSITVRCVRIDDHVSEDHVVGFVKVDVEGADLAVLRGGDAMLRRCRPTILFEWTRDGADAFDLDPASMHDFLTGEHGYAIHVVATWLADGPPLDRAGFVEAMTYPFAAFNFLAVPRG